MNVVAFVKRTPSAALLDVHSWVDMLFLPLTILTDTGMGDILPTTGHAKSVVMVVQAVGLFHVAMVVTRLIGLQAMRKRV